MKTDEIFAQLLDGRQYMTVVLPFPDRDLQPNNRNGRHYFSSGEAKKSAKAEAKAEAMNAGFSSLGGGKSYIIWLSIFQRDNGAAGYDIDNMVAACKHYIDGVFLAMHTPDSRAKALIATDEGRKGNGRVEITVIKL